MTAALVALLLVLAALVATMAPLLGREPAVEEADPDTEKLRADAISALVDADMDLALGKVTAEDHAAARGRLEQRALRAIADAHDGGDGADGPRG